jgi:ribose transport system ATP-binding protein
MSETSPPLLSVETLTKSFVGKPVLSALDLTVERGEVHALLGENGSGKSTLIKILSGYHTPDAGGRVRVDDEELSFGSPAASFAAGLRFVHQDLGLIDTETVADNLALSAGFPTLLGTVRRRSARRLAQSDLARVDLDVDPDAIVGKLSPAQRSGVAIARALRSSRDVPVRLLVLDEPTAALPQAEVKHLLSMIRSVTAAGVGVLYVTHRLDEVFSIANRVTVLRDGHRQATVATNDIDRNGLVMLLIGTELEEVKRASAEVHVSTGEVRLTVRDLHAQGVDGVSFDVHPGDIVGVAGITGSGRESLLAAVFGAHPRSAGTVTVTDAAVRPARPDLSCAAGMAYVPPDRKSLAAIMGLSARENLSLSNLRPFWRHGLISRRIERAETKRWFDRLAVRPSVFDQPLATFSGGNQQKIVMAKWLRRRPSVLLLDEPTQGVDIAAKAQLHREIIAAASAGCAVVISSSDVDELVALCHRVLVLRNGRLIEHLVNGAVTVRAVTQAILGSELEGATV